VTDKAQLDRIEKKLDGALEKIAAHHSDLAWIKRIFTGVGSILVLAVGHLLRKIGI
jgi:hypothetical protein